MSWSWQELRVLCNHRAWMEAACCSLRREIQTVKSWGTKVGAAVGDPSLMCNGTAWDCNLDLWRKYFARNLRPRVEMIGECQNDVLLLPEMSKAEQAWLAKKRTIPIVLPSGSTATARLCHLVKQHSGYIGSGILLDSAYILSATFLDAAQLAWGNPSCYCSLAESWHLIKFPGRTVLVRTSTYFKKFM